MTQAGNTPSNAKNDLRKSAGQSVDPKGGVPPPYKGGTGPPSLPQPPSEGPGEPSEPDELTKMTVRWRRTRAKYEDLHRRHDYLFAAWQNAVVENDRLRAEIAKLREDQ